VADQPGPLTSVPRAPLVSSIYTTELGEMYRATIEDFLASEHARRLKGKVQLVFTSPPFPLLTPKAYGNKVGDEYLKWLKDLAPKLKRLLTPDGSIVIELGNAWERGHPVMSTLPLEALMSFQKAGKLFVNQQFICHNPARLPSPVQWVNIDRSRVKDSYTHVWWMSPTERPKADNRKVLVPYSASMKKLIARKKYNAGPRGSGFNIGETSFLTDHGGAIPPSVLTYANTQAGTPYRKYLKANGYTPHPAPMQAKLVEFFVEFLTDPEDLVFDPFGGSNTTGAVAERLGRRWIATEQKMEYILGSKGHFPTFNPLAAPRTRKPKAATD
jgi:site-specific DNA-methyltransferase (cytosine-N4-specific)